MANAKFYKKVIIIFTISIFFIILFFKGYFSSSVRSLIVVNAKIKSSLYIEQIIEENVIKEDTGLFYEGVSKDGVLICQFDTVKANKILVDCQKQLRGISNDFGEFTCSVPISYIFIPTSYILPDIKLDVKSSGLMYYDVKIKTDIKEYGINSSLVSLVLVIDIKYQVTVPFMMEIVDNSIEVLLAVKIISGALPSGLYNY